MILENNMTLTRRKVLVLGGSALAVGSLAGAPAFASLTDNAIAEMTGGAQIGEGAITLSAPEIAENGNTVPISIDAPGAAAITLFADACLKSEHPEKYATTEHKTQCLFLVC